MKYVLIVFMLFNLAQTSMASEPTQVAMWPWTKKPKPTIPVVAPKPVAPMPVVSPIVTPSPMPTVDQSLNFKPVTPKQPVCTGPNCPTGACNTAGKGSQRSCNATGCASGACGDGAPRWRVERSRTVFRGRFFGGCRLGGRCG